MKVAISVPDPIFEVAERVSKTMGMSRSQLYSRALEAYLKQNRGRGVREALEDVYGEERSGIDPLLEVLQAEALREAW